MGDGHGQCNIGDMHSKQQVGYRQRRSIHRDWVVNLGHSRTYQGFIMIRYSQLNDVESRSGDRLYKQQQKTKKILQSIYSLYSISDINNSLWCIYSLFPLSIDYPKPNKFIGLHCPCSRNFEQIHHLSTNTQSNCTLHWFH